MNMKKIIASVAASALAVSALATNAFAAITNANGDSFGQAGKYIFEAGKDLGDKLGDCYGVTVNITAADAELPEGIGGGICANNEPFAWTEFGNEGSGKAIITDGKTITLKSDSALFAMGEESQIVIEGWWGSDFTVDGVTYLDKDGKDMSGAAPAAESTTAAAPATTEAANNAAAPADDKGSPDTGVEGVAVVAALAVLAGGAIVVAKKRK